MVTGADPGFGRWVFKIPKDVNNFNSSNLMINFKTKIEFITSHLILCSDLVSVRPTC